MCLVALVVGLAAVASCHFTESLEGYDSEYRLGAGGSAAGAGGTAGGGGDGGGGTNPDGGDVYTPQDGADVQKDSDAATPDTPIDVPFETLPDGGNCVPGRLDCDGNEGNGCETDTTNDNKNCGGCGHECAGGLCASSKCQPVVLAENQAMPWSIAVDSTKVFWSNQGSGAVKGSINSIPIAGGTSATLKAEQGTPGDIVLDSQNVYWSNYSDGGAILKVRKDGQDFLSLTSSSGPWGITVDSSNVYWTISAGEIRTIPIAGGSSSWLVQSENDPRAITVSGGKLYWSTTGSPGEAGPVAVGKIRSSNLDGSNKQDLATGQAFPLGMVVTSTDIFWVSTGTYSLGDCSQQDGKVLKMAKSNPGVVTTLAQSQACPTRLAVDNDTVYWANLGTSSGSSYSYNGMIMKVPMTGGTPVAMVSSGDLVVKPYGIAVDATNVYWTSQGVGPSQGKIARVVKD